MSSVTTNPLSWALARFHEWRADDPERRPSYDVWPDDAPPPADSTPGKLAKDGTIGSTRHLLASGEVTCRELVDRSLEAIKKDNDRLFAFVEILEVEAYEQAQKFDNDLKSGRTRGALHGIPISVKDVIHVRGATTRAGSLAYEQRASRDASSVKSLRDAGAVILGKTSPHEFAMGITSARSRNPHDRSRVPGGSSGGSAISVATGMAMASLCTDTRGSVRVPASLTGVVGIKPTYGTIPTDGIVPLSWTMDHVGVLAPSVADAATVLDVLSGGGSASSGFGIDISGMRIGVPRAAWLDAESEVETSIEFALEFLAAAGAELVEVARPSEQDFADAQSASMVVSRCEAASFHRSLGKDRALYWEEVRDQLSVAEEVLAMDYIDAQRFRAEQREAMLAEISGVDAFVMPTTPIVAPLVEEAAEKTTLLARNSALWSFVGFPAMSVPSAASPAGLPIGLQIVAAPYAEATLVAVGRAVERGVNAR